MTRLMRHRRSGRLGLTVVAGVIVGLAVFGGAAASAPAQPTTEIRLITLPIANALPQQLGIRKGFFAAEGIELKTTTLQSGNDVVLAMANNNGDVGYAGFVPMMIGSTSGIALEVLASSEVEGTTAADNWQNILVKGSSSIRTDRDLAGKTIAVNALKGVGEIMIKAALEKRGIRLSSVRLVAIPFPQMRSALNNGQVDAIWTPEPFLSQALNIDNARIVMAPGPVLGNYFPIGGYAVKPSWKAQNRSLAARFRRAVNRSLLYAQSHPDEIRALLPTGTQNVRLPIWSTLVGSRQAAAARGLCEEIRRHHEDAEHEAARPEQHRERARPAGNRAGPPGAAPRGRAAGDDAGRRPVHVRGHRQLPDPELQAEGPRRESPDERPGAGPDDLDGEPPQGHVPVLVQRQPGSEEELQGRLNN